jgi:hypothetical protein
MGREMNTILFWLVVIIALVAIGPLLTIWAFNTLFPVLAIPYALDTWAAVVLLGVFIRANVTVKK